VTEGMCDGHSCVTIKKRNLLALWLQLAQYLESIVFNSNKWVQHTVEW